MKPLARPFYARDTLTVARELLGQRLVRLRDGERLSGTIVEVEAYIGEEDEACHASRGRTRRNGAMYGPPGQAYVYLIYGIHHCLNLVTEKEGVPAAVLVRALEPLEGLGAMSELRGRTNPRELTSGPGRLCQAFGIDRSFDRADLCTGGALLFIEAGTPVPDERVAAGPRVGVTGNDRAIFAPWRLSLRDSPFVSRP
jgi:DNA-3-methyladenine glycosylase